jgi:ABC transporter with metal-binding/Fe-S-binding domain ATP-binding protein
MKKAAVLFSGGKDSCLALYIAMKRYRIGYLLSIISENFDSFMFHKPYPELLKKQAEMLGMKDKLIVGRSKGIENEELKDLRELIKRVRGRVDVIVAGGIASSYQGKRIKKICNDLGLEFYAPLWDYDGERVWRELLDRKFKVILTKISCEGLGREWLGRVIDKKGFEGLRKIADKYKFRVDFEGGEAESAVLFMPEFKKEIRVKYSIKSEGEYRHFLDVEEVR